MTNLEAFPTIDLCTLDTVTGGWSWKDLGQSVLKHATVAGAGLAVAGGIMAGPPGAGTGLAAGIVGGGVAGAVEYIGTQTGSW